MSGPPQRGVVSWEPSPKDDLPAHSRREAPYGRSVGWAIVAWIVSVAAVYFVSRFLGLPELGGWVGLSGVIVGGWFGGTRGGIEGWRHWVIFGLMLSVILILVTGLASCAYAMALYG